jgi:RNase P subunit RPR2
MSDDPLRFCPRCDRSNLVAVRAQRMRSADYPPEQVEDPLVFQTCPDCGWDNFSEKFTEHGHWTPGS